jgi:hypothetical protein
MKGMKGRPRRGLGVNGFNGSSRAETKTAWINGRYRARTCDLTGVIDPLRFAEKLGKTCVYGHFMRFLVICKVSHFVALTGVFRVHSRNSHSKNGSIAAYGNR